MEFTISTNPNKKYDIIVNGSGPDRPHGPKKISFGSRKHQHYHDKIGMYSSLDHNDPIRRQAYRNRHSKILLADGRPAYKVRYTPAWFSWNYLW
jgi:hypothetical protein